MLNRRELIKCMGCGVAGLSLPTVTFARADTDARFVLVILRGAVDGLAMAAPYGDGNYRQQRGELALPAPGQEGGALKLDGLFGLHPALPYVHKLYRNEEALLAHAVSSPYRERSHFDGQDVLENGATSVGRLRDGWLNRALAPLGGTVGQEVAIALSPTTPLVLRGDNSVTSWAPSQLPEADDDLLARIADMYAQDEFFAMRFAQALDSQEIASGMQGISEQRRGNEAQRIAELVQSAARFLTSANGPRIAVLESGGWDTHANQGATNGALANKFRVLDESISALHRGMGDHWADTVVMVVTEFGRTVKVNGTRGTDHGTATAALLLGGAVRGGRVLADWPGLAPAQLYENRDLYPTTDIRSLFKGVLAGHLGLQPAFLETAVFPDSQFASPQDGLIRS